MLNDAAVFDDEGRYEIACHMYVISPQNKIGQIFLCKENGNTSTEFVHLLRLPVGLRRASSAMMRFEESVENLPMREAGRFKEKNLKWTAKDYKSYADSHANALLEFRFKRGDSVAVWMAPCDHKVFSNKVTDSSGSFSASFSRVNVVSVILAYLSLGLRKNGHARVRY